MFAAVALHGSSIVFNAIVILLGLTLPQAFDHYWRRPWLNPATVSGILGIGVTALLWIIYVIRAQGLIDLADRFKHSESAAQSRISKGIPPQETGNPRFTRIQKSTKLWAKSFLTGVARGVA